MSEIDPDRIKAIAFDCFGTLVDWEAGILSALGSLFERHRVTDPPGDVELLRLFAELEAKAEAGPYVSYRDVLGEVTAGFAQRLGFPLPTMDRGILADSMRRWPVFADTAKGLRRLKSTYRLAIVSNVDDDLFAGVETRLGLAAVGGFDAVVTAEQVRSYKPGETHFVEVAERLGVERHEVLIAGCSLYHDIVPASGLGMPTCWVDRGQLGASGDAEAEPGMVVGSIAELADRLGC